MVASVICLLAVAALPNPNPWRAVRNDGDTRIWARDVPNSNVREVRAQTVVDSPPERVFNVIGDIEHYTDFMPYVVEAREVGRNGDHPLQYFRINPPLIKQRDYTLEVSLEEDIDKGVFVRRWTASNNRGPTKRDDSVRLAICDGSWVVKRLADDRSEVTYWVYSDPSGAIPSWLVNHANKSSLPDVLDAVRKRSMDPSWKP